MRDLLNTIADMSDTARTVTMVGISVVGVSTLVAALFFSFRASRDRARGVIHLSLSAWNMDLNEVLRGWTTEEGRSRPAKLAIVMDAVSELCLGAGIVIAIASLEGSSSIEWLDDLAEPASWIAAVALALVVLNLFSQLRMIRVYEKDGTLWWLGASLSLTSIGLRVLAFAASLLWIVSVISSTT